MAQILLIYDNPKLGQMYSLNLGIYLGTDVIYKEDLLSAQKLLEVHSSMDMIICKSHLYTQPSAIELSAFVKEKRLNIPILVIGKDDSLPEEVHTMDLGSDSAPLIDQVSKMLNMSVDYVAKSSLTAFCNLDVDVFHALKQAPCDIYQRSKRKPGEYNFVKKLNQGTEITNNEILRYQYEGINQLFVKSEDYESFIETYTASVHYLLDQEELSTEKRVVVTSASMKTVSEQIATLGLSSETILTAQKTMKSIMTMTSKTIEFKKILNLLFSGRPNFHFNHTQVCTYICSHIVNNLDHGKESKTKKGVQANIETLGFVSFFHDITLIDQKLSMVRTEKELKQSKFSKKEQEQVLNHANEAIVLLEKFPNAPIGSDIIIRQHHGSRSGVGFPTFFSQDISPLAIIFIVAQDLTDRILECNGESFNLRIALQKMREKFKPRQYHKIIDTLEKLNI